jgi:hypothetical protein
MSTWDTDLTGWTAEVMDLECTNPPRRFNPAGTPLDPVGDGAQICARLNGKVMAFVRTPDELAAAGVPMHEVTIIRPRQRDPLALAA